MRDLILLVLIGGTAMWALRRPWVGAILWTNLSLMSPHVEFGYSAAYWPVASVAAITTLTGLLLTREKQTPMLAPPMWALLAFVIWICITLPFSFYVDESLPLWVRSMKIYLMLFVTAALLDTRHKLDTFVWVNAVSIGYYGVKGGIFTIATAGNYRVWGPGGFIEGNNEVALALITVIPLMRYLQLRLEKRWQSLAMGAAMGLCAITAIGTYSRGALVGLVAMAFVLWAKNKNKVAWGVAMVAVGLAILSFMPEQWWARMNTIQTYEQDDSALGRINAWWNAWYVALNRVFGGGFMIYSAEVFARYSPDPARVHAAHSIYFQVLGEHGFIGLGLFLGIGALTWTTSRRLIAMGVKHPAQRWAADLGAMVQVSMAGFATSGAFLSLAYFDLPYNMMLMAAAAWRLASFEAAQPVTSQPPPGPATVHQPLGRKT